MKLFTIGVTKTTAEHFFDRIKGSGAKCIIDVRLHNVSHLAGFAKRDDLRYFARAICGIDYRHVVSLAPTQAILDKIKNGGDWLEYESSFLDLMEARQVENMNRTTLEGGCLLCVEDKPDYCHRRLVAEYLKRHWTNIAINHL
jgi:uncharacterized protein (DUF488 family)